MVAQMQQATSFGEAAQLREQPLNRIPWVANGGAPVTQDLRNVGLLHRLQAVVTTSTTYVTAGPTGFDAMNQYCGPIQRIAVRANSVGVLYDVTGFLAAIISAITAQYDFGNSVLNPRPFSFTSSPGTAATTNQWSFQIPISLYLTNFEAPLGLFQTAISGQETQVEVRFATIAGNTNAIGSNLYTGNPANISVQSGNIDLQQVYFEPIVSDAARPPQDYVHVWSDIQFGWTADGDTELKLPAAHLYMRLILVLVQGATAATLALQDNTVTRVRLIYGANIAPLDFTRDQLIARMARQYPALYPTLPAGVLVIDLLQETKTERDWLNAASTTELRVVVSNTGGSYAGGAYIRVGMERLIPFVQPTPGQVGVQGVN